jgi:hypothetical protein
VLSRGAVERVAASVLCRSFWISDSASGIGSAVTVVYPKHSYKEARDKPVVTQRLPNSIDDITSDLDKVVALRIGNTWLSCAAEGTWANRI